MPKKEKKEAKRLSKNGAYVADGEGCILNMHVKVRN